jgi:hypothetical protein
VKRRSFMKLLGFGAGAAVAGKLPDLSDLSRETVPLQQEPLDWSAWSPMTASGGVLTASGGFCAPMEPVYYLEVQDGRGDLRCFQVPRGGVHFQLPADARRQS